MLRWMKSLRLALLVVATVGPAVAQTSAPEPLYDPTKLPAFHGTLQLFTLTPRGDIDGFVLTDGTEVKTPPHLTADLAATVKPGDRVTVHGLKAASLPLVQAMSVGNDATGSAVVDAGPSPDRARLPALRRGGAAPIALGGRLRMLLHGPRGDVNGALLDDGTVLKLPPPEAERLANLLAPGRTIAAEGNRYTTPDGAFVDLTALGAAGGPLQPIAGAPRSGSMPAPPPPG